MHFAEAEEGGAAEAIGSLLGDEERRGRLVAASQDLLRGPLSMRTVLGQALGQELG